MDSRSQTLFTAFLRDISDRRQAEEARLQLSAIVESSDDAIVGNSLDGTILTWNNGAERIYGYTAEEAVGRSIAMLAPPERAREVMVMLGKIGLGERVEHYETCRVRKDGSPIQVSLTVSPVKDATGRTVGASAIARDITERKKAEEEVRRLAFHDTLTDLPNRLLFQDRLAVAIAQARRSRTHVAVIFVDLDGFKRINDSLGHSAGDDLLRRVADRIRSCLREADTVARFGGDEFVVLVPGIASSDDAERIGDKLLKAMRTPFGIDRRRLEITASLGISVYPGDGRDGRALLRNADRAMYRAKEGGRDNLQLYKAALSPAALERLALERQLRDAMGQGDLVVHYQPFVDLESGEIRGAEALIRWQHPSLGLLEPSEFVSLAESSGLIVPIGRWILRTACEQARSWRTRGHPGLRIAVNLSSREFLQPDLVETVRETLQNVGLDSTSLDLEITESSALHNPERVVDTLSDLRSLGVTIAMDDFGTGYSSLSHLRSLPIDRLKIDQSFVRDVANHRGDAAIATAVIAMAHSLGMSVVAEGVETVPQLAFLRARQCDEMQGYLVSRPLPPDQFTEFLSWRRSGRQAPWGPTVRPGAA
jgi:diguanylate cyclase (GGDEF)-like protein/PAS domain S-box-containing protein